MAIKRLVSSSVPTTGLNETERPDLAHTELDRLLAAKQEKGIPAAKEGPHQNLVAKVPHENSPSRFGGKRRDLMQEVADKMIQSIEEETAPWQRSWKSNFGWPRNATTGKPYHGHNILLLALGDFQDPRWCTFEQAKKAGWQVRRGEKHTPIYFYKVEHKPTDEIDLATGLPKVKRIPIFKSFQVFNLSQIDKAPALDVAVSHLEMVAPSTIQAIEEIVENAGIEVIHGRTRPYFSPAEDNRVYMPEKRSFKSDAHYYATLLHEIGHWSGGATRLNRTFGADKDSPEYAREELRAEIASAMMGMYLGLPPGVENHEGYVASYLTLLKGDKREIFRAAKDAETITRFVLRYSPELCAQLGEEVREQAQAAAEAGCPDEIFDAALFEDFDERPSFKP